MAAPDEPGFTPPVFLPDNTPLPLPPGWISPDIAAPSLPPADLNPDEYNLPLPKPGDEYHLIEAPDGTIIIEDQDQGEGFSEPLEQYRVIPLPPGRSPPRLPPSSRSESRARGRSRQREPQGVAIEALGGVRAGRELRVPRGRSRVPTRETEAFFPTYGLGAVIPRTRIPPIETRPMQPPARVPPPLEGEVIPGQPQVKPGREGVTVEGQSTEIGGRRKPIPGTRKERVEEARARRRREADEKLERQREVPLPPPGRKTRRGPFGTEQQGRVVVIGRGEAPTPSGLGGVKRGRVIVTAPQPIPTPRPLPPTRPEPVPVPLPPKIEVPHPDLPAPLPKTPPGPVQTPAPTPIPTPSPFPTQTPGAAALPAVALGALAWFAASHLPSTLTPQRAQPRTSTAGPPPVPPAATPRSTPTPSPAPSPLTAVTVAGVGSRCSPDPESCRKAKEQRKRERDAKCKSFIKIPVRAHKKTVCVQDLAKFLLRKFKSKAVRGIKAELKKHGIEMLKKPRRRKLPDIELGGGVEIDVGDLLKGK